MKRFSFLLTFILSITAGAASLPNNIYMQAMQDEMTRTKKQLRVPGSARPFYIAYRIQRAESQSFEANMGMLYKNALTDGNDKVMMSVYIYAGDKQNNSSGFKDDYYSSTVLSGISAKSYEALRQDLWQLTDLEYVKASNVADKKAAYKRRKHMTQEPADFSFAPQASFVEEITPFVVREAAPYNKLVKELSAQGKSLGYLEQYQVIVRFSQKDTYFLDSEHNFSQWQTQSNTVFFMADLRNLDGYKERVSATYDLPLEEAQAEVFIRTKAAVFLQRVEQVRRAKKAEAYVGPVLFESEGAAGFFNQLFVKNSQNTKPLLSASQETDGTAGLFKDKLGMRVMSPAWNVWDKPLERMYGNIPLRGFMPMDGEGVAAQPLHLVEKGKLTALPLIRSLIPGQKQSNGHARFNKSYPRAQLTNVFFEPEQTVSAAQLEQKLLQRCRELGLEYGYIFHTFPEIIAERIYVADGRREPVYNVKLAGQSARSLRDILAASADPGVYSFDQVSVITPSILVDEIEIVPSQRQPDRKPFLTLPK